MNLFNIFQTLVINNNYNFSVESIGNHFIGKDQSGFATLLIRLNENNEKLEIKRVNLDISVKNCTISSKNETITEDFLIIICKNHNEFIVKSFFDLALLIFEKSENKAKLRDLTNFIDDLEELFRSLGKSSSKGVKGLWAELFVILLSDDINMAIDSWRQSDEKIWDFSHDVDRLEVKSTESAIRKHHFSYEQLNPPKGINVSICSILMEEVGNGLSVFNLVDIIKSKVNLERCKKINRNIVKTLGKNLPAAESIFYNPHFSNNTIKIINYENIPSIKYKHPLVNNVKFVSEIIDNKNIDNSKNKLAENINMNYNF